MPQTTPVIDHADPEPSAPGAVPETSGERKHSAEPSWRHHALAILLMLLLLGVLTLTAY